MDKLFVNNHSMASATPDYPSPARMLLHQEREAGCNDAPALEMHNTWTLSGRSRRDLF
jgi:hypothetical protein